MESSLVPRDQARAHPTPRAHLGTHGHGQGPWGGRTEGQCSLARKPGSKRSTGRKKKKQSVIVPVTVTVTVSLPVSNSPLRHIPVPRSPWPPSITPGRQFRAIHHPPSTAHRSYRLVSYQPTHPSLLRQSHVIKTPCRRLGLQAPDVTSSWSDAGPCPEHMCVSGLNRWPLTPCEAGWPRRGVGS